MVMSAKFHASVKLFRQPTDDGNQASDAEDGQKNRAVLDEANVAFRIEVVADQAREREGENRERNEVNAHLAHSGIDGHLHERHAVELAKGSTGLYIENQDHESGAGAHDQRVNVDGKALHQTLLDGVERRLQLQRRSGREPIPASLENRPRLMPRTTTEPAKPPKIDWKSKADSPMSGEHGGQLVEVGERDEQTKTDISKSHDGHHDGGDDADALGTAENDERRHDNEDNAQSNRCAVRGVIGNVVLKRTLPC